MGSFIISNADSIGVLKNQKNIIFSSFIRIKIFPWDFLYFIKCSKKGAIVLKFLSSLKNRTWNEILQILLIDVKFVSSRFFNELKYVIHLLPLMDVGCDSIFHNMSTATSGANEVHLAWLIFLINFFFGKILSPGVTGLEVAVGKRTLFFRLAMETCIRKQWRGK